MDIDITASFTFELHQPTDILLQFEAAYIPEQVVVTANTQLSTSSHFARVPAEDDIGERIWVHADGLFEVAYTAHVQLNRVLTEIDMLARMEPHLLPGETVQYLLASRYCPADRFQIFVEAEFGDSNGGERIAAIRDWIAKNFTYVPGSSTSTTTALDSFIERRGICRDFAHVLITLARASGIPARYVSAYAPRVSPQDFHAVAEVFLADSNGTSGSWHLIDATGMADPASTVKIGVGRDATDVSFLTSFGPLQMNNQQINVNARL